MTKKKTNAAEAFVDCDHIIAYEEGVYETWLCYLSKPPYGGEIYSTQRFNYCPLCGEKIEWEQPWDVVSQERAD